MTQMVYIVFILLINVKMPTIVGILTLISRTNFRLNSDEPEKSFILLMPGPAFLLKIHISQYTRFFFCLCEGIARA